MKPRVSSQKTAALTLVEVLMVIVALGVVVTIVLPALARLPHKVKKAKCINNLMQFDVAFHNWQEDHNISYPMQVSVTNGGSMELVVTGDVAATFQVMSNELSTPKILICPADLSRDYAANFTTDFNNSRTSYFIGVDAEEQYPQRVLSGDANFEIGGVPVKSGLLELSTNLNIAWTSSRHFIDNSHFWTRTGRQSFGNILLAEGSVQTLVNTNLGNQFQQTGLATNRLAIP